MSEPLEDELRAWLDDRGASDPVALAAVSARIDALPARRGRAGRPLLVAFAAVVVVAVVATLLATGVSGPLVGAVRPTPPDPAAFAGDPRLDHCGIDVAHAAAIFEMAHLSDYQRHLPRAYPLTGLVANLADPALVVVGAEPSAGGREPLPVSPAPTLDPRLHDLCIVPAADGDWGPIAVIGVDTSGLIVTLPSDSAVPSPVPPDPAAFAGDPRFLACGGAGGHAEFAFEMAHARDYRKHLPAMGLSPELDADDPAFVVVLQPGFGPAFGGVPPAPSSSMDSPTPIVGNPVCVLVGTTTNFYDGVDIKGMRVDIGPDTPTTPPSATATADELPDIGPFVDDPRFLACRDHGLAVSAFEIGHARDIGHYLPAVEVGVGELATSDPLLVVLMGPDYPVPAVPGPSGAEPPPPSSDTFRYACLVVGPAAASTVGYSMFSIVGFDPKPPGLGPTPEPS